MRHIPRIVFRELGYVRGDLMAPNLGEEEPLLEADPRPATRSSAGRSLLACGLLFIAVSGAFALSRGPSVDTITPAAGLEGDALVPTLATQSPTAPASASSSTTSTPASTRTVASARKTGKSGSDDDDDRTGKSGSDDDDDRTKYSDFKNTAFPNNTIGIYKRTHACANAAEDVILQQSVLGAIATLELAGSVGGQVDDDEAGFPEASCMKRAAATTAANFSVHDVETEKFHTGTYKPHHWWKYIASVHGPFTTLDGFKGWNDFMVRSRFAFAARRRGSPSRFDLCRAPLSSVASHRRISLTRLVCRLLRRTRSATSSPTSPTTLRRGRSTA
jgi:hypothetical protein